MKIQTESMKGKRCPHKMGVIICQEGFCSSCCIYLNKKEVTKMGYCCANCGDGEHTCTAWDGKGDTPIQGKPNHNLVNDCPEDVTKCEYRKEKMPSKPMGVKK